MPQTRTIDELERALQGTREETLDGPMLARIRAGGRSSRRRRRAAYAVSGAAVVVAGGLLTGLLTPGGDRAQEQGPATGTEEPTALSPLAERALAEIPGARQVSDWQVVIPAPDVARQQHEERVAERFIERGPVDIGASHNAGVTSYPRRGFPGWLYQGTLDFERDELGDESGHPVGSTDSGVIVDAGTLELACIGSLPRWDKDREACSPAMLGEVDGTRTYAWGMGADGFLEPGQPLQLFTSKTYVSGEEATVWLGGTDGTDVVSVTLIGTDGTEVAATVASGTLVPGDTMFWGTVEGDLAVAVTRDADGTVLERHEVRPCLNPVDCEVR